MKASEKIAKLEAQLDRGLITPDEFASEAKQVLETAIREQLLVEGEIWYAKDKSGEGMSFLVRKVAHQDELTLWQLTSNPSHCPMSYWTKTCGYTGWKRTLAAPKQ